MVAFIDDHDDVYGVEPICAVLPIAPSTSHWHKARQRDPALVSARARRDRDLRGHVRRVWQTDHCVYGARKLWHELRREGHRVARCTVERLMRQMGLEGVTRSRAWTTTTDSTSTTSRPADLVDRDFTVAAPNRLWVADYTFVATWRLLHRVRHRRLRAADRRLALLDASARRVRARRARAGHP